MVFSSSPIACFSPCACQIQVVFRFAIYLFVATLIPFGTFVTDRKLRKIQGTDRPV